MQIVFIAIVTGFILSACGGSPVEKSAKKLQQGCTRIVATFGPNDADMVPAGFCTCLSETLTEKTSPESLALIANAFAISKDVDEFEDSLDKIAENNKQLGTALRDVSDFCMGDQ